MTETEQQLVNVLIDALKQTHQFFAVLDNGLPNTDPITEMRRKFHAPILSTINNALFLANGSGAEVVDYRGMEGLVMSALVYSLFSICQTHFVSDRTDDEQETMENAETLLRSLFKGRPDRLAVVGLKP